MRTTSFQVSFVLVGALLLLGIARSAAAAPTKEECLEAHSRGQDQSEAGHLALARDSFAVCSQPTCPALVQTDCAQFSEELARLSPSVIFAARDRHANDLPDTQVYVDGALIARRLEEGRPYEIDPGKHAVRFVHQDRDVLLNVVINEGEHGRNLIATFADPAEAALATRAASVADASGSLAPSADHAQREVFPLVLVVAGGAALATGAVLTGVGFAKVPGNCSLQTRECTAPPGDPAFGRAHQGISLVNAGLATAIAGAVVGISGLVWYFAQPLEPTRTASAGLRFTGTGFVF